MMFDNSIPNCRCAVVPAQDERVSDYFRVDWRKRFDILTFDHSQGYLWIYETRVGWQYAVTVPVAAIPLETIGM